VLCVLYLKKIQCKSIFYNVKLDIYIYRSQVKYIYIEMTKLLDFVIFLKK